MQTISNSPTRKQGIVMFSILITAYVVFATNWVAGSTLSKQITDYYFNGEKVSPIISEVVNYTITISRIVANLLAAFILIKLHPKKAALIALFCLCFSFFAIFTHSYWLYTHLLQNLFQMIKKLLPVQLLQHLIISELL